MILGVVTAALVLGMALALIRGIRGPSVFARILASNSFNTKTLLLIAVIGFVSDSPENYIDISLMYAIIGFIGTVAVLRCVEYGGFLGEDEQDS